jgi:hypothetical protein
MFSRCLEYVANPLDKSVVGLIRVLASHLSWILLYFMVFEMMYIHAKIQSESLEDLRRNRHTINRHRLVLFASFVLLYQVPSILIFDPILDIRDATVKVLLVIRCAKIPIDVYIFKKFISLFGMFVRRKIERLEKSYYEKNGRDAPEFETPKNLKFIIVWTMLLTFMKALISFCAIFVYGLYNF